MIPVDTPLTEWSFHLPGRPGEGEMPCARRDGATWTFWRAEKADDVERAGSVEVLYQWNRPLTVGLGFVTAELGWEKVVVDDQVALRANGGVQASGTLDDTQRTFLREGGLLVVRVGMVPPPPVSVWLAPSGVTS